MKTLLLALLTSLLLQACSEHKKFVPTRYDCVSALSADSQISNETAIVYINNFPGPNPSFRVFASSYTLPRNVVEWIKGGCSADAIMLVNSLEPAGAGFRSYFSVHEMNTIMGLHQACLQCTGQHYRGDGICIQNCMGPQPSLPGSAPDIAELRVDASEYYRQCNPALPNHFDEVRSIIITRSDWEQLSLSRPEVGSIRIFHAIDGNQRCIIMTGVDANGKMLLDATHHAYKAGDDRLCPRACVVF